MDESSSPLEGGEGLETWLNRQDNTLFPAFSTDRGEKPYPERYTELRAALVPTHNRVEKAALAKSAMDWIAEAIRLAEAASEGDKSQQIKEDLRLLDPIAYLNNHGTGHVAKVIQKVSEMLRHFERGHLTAYEGFLLLCAVQVHDVGNIFGRADHEKRCEEILYNKGASFLPDRIERKNIAKIALVHGGIIDSDRDTIGLLSEDKLLHDRTVRKRLLAALLRFGDELADDSTRADRDGLEDGSIPMESIIYHQYSQALHTVMIDKNPVTNKLELKLSFEFNSDLATQKFRKNTEDKYLLDEIYDRTLKMERERRYCMRFLRPCFSLDSIKVEIEIQNSRNAFKSDKIRYALEETGYPSAPASGRIKDFQSDLRSGEEETSYLISEWGLS